MGYLHIDNLYKNQEILLFKECYALEKIHGSSANVSFEDGELSFFSGGQSHDRFVALFDVPTLTEKLKGTGVSHVVIYGEVYGGSCQKMSTVYGKDLKFIAFDVQIDDCWLSVPQAYDFVIDLGLEFVEWVKISTDIEELNSERDLDSMQAIRNGMGEGHPREGIVLRPLIEVTKNNGKRIIVKHKGEKFSETKTPRKIDDPEKLKVLRDAQLIAEEWVTPMRITHVLDKIEDAGMEKMREIIYAMQEDIKREGEGEVVWSDVVSKSIGKLTAQMVKEHFNAQLI